MSRPFLKSLFSLSAMGCCGINGYAKEEAEEEKRAKKTNKDIERQIQKDKQVCQLIQFKHGQLNQKSLFVSEHG